MKIVITFVLFLVSGSLDTMYSKILSEGTMTLRNEIHAHIQKTIFKPVLLEQLPEHDPAIKEKFIREVKIAVTDKYPEMTPEHIHRVIWPKEGWRTMREEFTGTNRGRYCFAFIVIDSDEKDVCWVVQINFMQKAKFFGLKHSPMYVRSILNVDKIPKNKILNEHKK